MEGKKLGSKAGMFVNVPLFVLTTSHQSDLESLGAAATVTFTDTHPTKEDPLLLLPGRQDAETGFFLRKKKPFNAGFNPCTRKYY